MKKLMRIRQRGNTARQFDTTTKTVDNFTYVTAQSFYSAPSEVGKLTYSVIYDYWHFLFLNLKIRTKIQFQNNSKMVIVDRYVGCDSRNMLQELNVRVILNKVDLGKGILYINERLHFYLDHLPDFHCYYFQNSRLGWSLPERVYSWLR